MSTVCLIVVDGLCEAEYHRPDYGDTIGSFLVRHALQFPHWLKLVVTVRTGLQDITQLLPYACVRLALFHRLLFVCFSFS